MMDIIARTNGGVRGGDIVDLEELRRRLEPGVEAHGGDIVDFFRLAAFVLEPDETRVLGVRKQSGLFGYFRRESGVVRWSFTECSKDEMRLLSVALDAAAAFGYALEHTRLDSGHVLAHWDVDDY